MPYTLFSKSLRLFGSSKRRLPLIFCKLKYFTRCQIQGNTERDADFPICGITKWATVVIVVMDDRKPTFQTAISAMIWHHRLGLASDMVKMEGLNKKLIKF